MSGLTDAERDLVEANLGLVTFCLQHWGVSDHDWSDARQDGVLGLARAAQKFDASRGYRFSTYACWWIRQAVQQGRSRAEGVNYRRALSRAPVDGPAGPGRRARGPQRGGGVTDLLVRVVALLRSMGCDCDATITVHQGALGVSVAIDHEHACRLQACMDRRN